MTLTTRWPLPLAAALAFPAAAATLSVPLDFASIDAALRNAESGDSIVVTGSDASNNQNEDSFIDFRGRAVDVTIFASQPQFSFENLQELIFADGASFSARFLGGGPGDELARLEFQSNFGTRLVVPADAEARLSASELNFANQGSGAPSNFLILGDNASLLVTADFDSYPDIIELGAGADLRVIPTGFVSGNVIQSGITLEPDSSLSLPGDFLGGTLIADNADVTIDEFNPSAGPATVLFEGGSLTVEAFELDPGPGDIVIFEGVDLSATEPQPVRIGSGSFFSGGSINFAFRLDVQNTGSNLPAVLEGVRLVGEQTQLSGTRVVGSGDWFTDLDVGGSTDLLITGDTRVFGQTQNAGDIIVQNGTITFFGGFDNSGTITGNFVDLIGPFDVPNPGTQPGSGVEIIDGGIQLGPDAEFSFPGGAFTVSFSGDFDAAIDDNARFDAATATLDVNAPADGSPVEFEAMSRDRGTSSAALDRGQPGAFPIGTLIVSAGVELRPVDRYDNDAGDAAPETIVVDTLILEPGASVDNTGGEVFAREVVGTGVVIGQPITPITSSPADFNGNGTTDIFDLIDFLVGFADGGAAADFNGDETVDIFDLIDFLVAFANSD